MYASLSTLKDWLLAESLRADYQWDGYIQSIGSGVAAAFDRYCNRVLGYTVGRQDYFRGNVEACSLSCYPVVSVTAIDFRRDVATDWESQTVNDVLMQLDTASGMARLFSVLGTSDEMVRITHTGGYWYATTTYPTLPTGATALPDDLLYAFRIQVESHFKIKDKIGLTIASDKQPEASYLYPIELKPMVTQILDSHVRHCVL